MGTPTSIYAHTLSLGGTPVAFSQIAVELPYPVENGIFIKTSSDAEPINIKIGDTGIYEVTDVTIFSITVGDPNDPSDLGKKALFTYTKKSD